MNDNRELLVEVKDLKTYFFLDEGTVKAVDGADFNIRRGETLGVVGESGCGKSVTARSILNIVPKPGKTVAGEILYHRKIKGAEQTLDLTQMAPQGDEMRGIRGAEIAMVFQEPMTSLSPVHTIGNQIGEAIRLHQGLDPDTARDLAI
ncbi:MAG TPA: ATP-binding cassette domain-containing protein, partial [Anaerolineae bacterium]|nr:ATP-binding cassette domain-containing protein [Anaerolineae bacterium]